jgi:hypothetical protein
VPYLSPLRIASQFSDTVANVYPWLRLPVHQSLLGSPLL